MEYFGKYGEKEKALELLLPVLDKALLAHEQGDYQAYMELITEELAERVTEEGFKRAHLEIAQTIGTLHSKTLLGAMNRGGNPMLLFAAKYEGSADDILINVTFRDATFPPKIDWLWIE